MSNEEEKDVLAQARRVIDAAAALYDKAAPRWMDQFVAQTQTSRREIFAYLTDLQADSAGICEDCGYGCGKWVMRGGSRR